MKKDRKKILVLCTGNSCRSQMAEAYLRHFADEKALIFSAGIEAHGVNSKAIAIMKEDGIDISCQTSNTIEEYRHIDFDCIITVCDNAKENCPFIPSKAKTFHRDFPDPSKVKGTEIEIQEAFQNTRNLIKDYCRSFVNDQFLNTSKGPDFNS